MATGIRTSSKISSNPCYAKRLARGVCPKCGGERLPDNKRCRSCWFKNVALNNTGTAKDAAMLEEIWLKQGGCCAYTGEPLVPGANASLDHKTPIARGGTNDRENLQWVLDVVNRMKTDMTHDEFVHLCWWIGGRS